MKQVERGEGRAWFGKYVVPRRGSLDTASWRNRFSCIVGLGDCGYVKKTNLEQWNIFIEKRFSNLDKCIRRKCPSLDHLTLSVNKTSLFFFFFNDCMRPLTHQVACSTQGFKCTHTHNYCYLIFDKEMENSDWRKANLFNWRKDNFFNKGFWESWISICGRIIEILSSPLAE